MSDARRQYDEWHRTLASEEGEGGVAPWHEAALPHLGTMQGARILEIGCGRGDFGRVLVRAGARAVVLADFSHTAVGVARDRVGTGAGRAFITADIERLPFPDGAFDLVCSFETIEHVPSPEAAVRELVRVTRVGGRVVITSPNYLGIAGLYRIYRRLIGRPFTEMGQPINQPLILPWRVGLLRALGCRLEKVDGFGHYLYLPGRNPTRIAFLDGFRWLTRWFGLHSLTVATRKR